MVVQYRDLFDWLYELDWHKNQNDSNQNKYDVNVWFLKNSGNCVYLLGMCVAIIRRQ